MEYEEVKCEMWYSLNGYTVTHKILGFIHDIDTWIVFKTDTCNRPIKSKLRTHAKTYEHYFNSYGQRIYLRDVERV